MSHNTRRIRLVVIAAAVAGAMLAGAGSALASDGGAFGQHVSHCAQEHGFSGSHNPGMHRGHAGHADADHEC